MTAAISTSDIDVPKSGSRRIRPNRVEHEQADRRQRVPDFVDAVHAPLEQRGDEEDRGQLRELRRLDPEAAEREPAPRVVDGRAEQHGHERERRPRRGSSR